jgi:hypothetical protein
VRSCLILVDQSCRQQVPWYTGLFCTKLSTHSLPACHNQGKHFYKMDSTSKIFWLSLRLIQLVVAMLILGLSAYGTLLSDTLHPMSSTTPTSSHSPNNSSLTTYSQHLLPLIPIHPLRTNNSPQLPPTKRLPHAPRPDLPHRRPRLPPYFEMERQNNGSMRGRPDGASVGCGLDCGRGAGYGADVYWGSLCGGAGRCCAGGF